MSKSDDLSFVRTEMLPEQAPPASQAGLVKWLRENLFNGWFNSILTVVALIIIYRLMSGFLPWLFGGVWTTSSLAECREVLDGATAGCFSVLTERWNQLLFGFKYPEDGYWRLILAFVLLFAALAPVLFPMVPRKLLIFTGLYPFIAFWLIWGGTILVPLFVLIGVLVAYLAYRRVVADSFVLGLVAAIVAAVIAWAVMLGPALYSAEVVIAETRMSEEARDDLHRLDDLLSTSEDALSLISAEVGWAYRTLPFYGDIFPVTPELAVSYDDAVKRVEDAHQLRRNFFAEEGRIGLEPVPSRDLGGYMLNMILGVVCVSLSLPLGILLALGRQSSMPIIKWICVVFIEFIRGVPLITLLFVANVVLAYFLPPGTNFDLVLRVIIMMTMFSSAYIAEVIRGGLAALPKGQYEAADSLGLDYAQAMRLIIMPQALKISIPGIVNVAVGLFKDTTLVSVISMFDLVGMIRGPILAATEWNGVYWELWGFAVMVFFIVCYSISQYSQWLERQLRTDHR